jgi:acyl-CoA thioesterase-1
MSTFKNTVYPFLVAFWVLLGFSCQPSAKEQQSTATPEQPVDSAAQNTIPAKTKTILFFGNSLTAGYGLDPAQAFPSLIQKKIDSLQLPYTVVNAGLSGETSAGGKARISWVLRQPVDVFVLELGANDGLRGVELTDTRKNLQAILDTVKTRNPATRLVIAGMQMPPNLGQKYTTDFRKLFPELAEKNQATLIPFLLDRVAGIASLNQTDGIHPTAEGHRLVAENVWKVLEPVLQKGT